MSQHTFRTMLIGIAMSCHMAGPGFAETFYVEMRNAKSDDPQAINVFEPPILKIAKGDTVVFLPIDNGHNSASKKGMIPDGVERWNSKIDKEFSVTFNTDGTYGYICIPHAQMGMVGLVLVGDYTVNYADAQKVRQAGRAKKVFKQLFSQIDQGGFE
ncbi:MAG: pseudoazurin [Hyphomicrobiales bacterium]